MHSDHEPSKGHTHRRAEEVPDDLAALRARRYPPFTWRRFMVIFGFGVFMTVCGAWSSITHYGEPRQLYVVRIQVLAFGLTMMGLAVLGRYLDSRGR